MRTDYRAMIETFAPMYGLDPDVVEALVLVESSGNTDAFRYEPEFYDRYLKDKEPWTHWNRRRISSSYGLCQVMAPVAYELGLTGPPERLFIPEVGLEYGCKKLAAELRWANGDLGKALAAYNAGRGNFKSAAGKAYAARVLTTLAENALEARA